MENLKKFKISILILLVILIFFPKKSGSIGIPQEKDYECICIGYNYKDSGPIVIDEEHYSLKLGKNGQNFCFGIPVYCRSIIDIYGKDLQGGVLFKK